MTFIYGYLKNPRIQILSDGWPNQIMTNTKMGGNPPFPSFRVPGIYRKNLEIQQMSYWTLDF